MHSTFSLRSYLSKKRRRLSLVQAMWDRRGVTSAQLDKRIALLLAHANRRKLQEIKIQGSHPYLTSRQRQPTPSSRLRVSHMFSPPLGWLWQEELVVTLKREDPTRVISRLSSMETLSSRARTGFTGPHLMALCLRGNSRRKSHLCISS